jgi:hypothetical protein
MGYISISQLSECIEVPLSLSPQLMLISVTADYVASKHALVGFMESLRFELDKKYVYHPSCVLLPF